MLLKNPGEKLKPNMLTSVRIKDYKNDQALVVPSFILRQDFKGSFLFRISQEDDKSKAQKAYVKPGITSQDQTMITEGLSAGDLVITKSAPTSAAIGDTITYSLVIENLSTTCT